MMESATAPREKLADAVVRIQRLEQLDLARSGLQQRRFDALVAHNFGFRQMQPERIAPQLHRGVQIWHDDPDMMNFLQHLNSPYGSGIGAARDRPIATSSRASPGSDARRVSR